MQTLSIIVFTIIYIYFYTPRCIVDIIYKFLCGKVMLTYIFNYSKYDKLSKVITYKFDHGFFDGSLISYHIKKSTSSHKRLIRTPQSLFDEYQIIKYTVPNNTKLYSSFTYAISSILKDMQDYYKIHYPKNEKINVCVIVSKRKLLKQKNRFGNYLRIAHYTINTTTSYAEICHLHNDVIKKEVVNKNALSSSGYDLYNYIQADICFNSHRDLSVIQRDDGNTLTLVTNKIFKNKHDMEAKMFSRDHKKTVFLNYFDDNWIVNQLKITK